MPGLRLMSAREVLRILEANGFVKVPQRGSHVVMQKKSGRMTTSAVVPNHQRIKIGTLGSIIRQSGLPRSLFEQP